jgi:dCMP deaminase
MRKDKINYYLDIADVVSNQCTCLRRRYGAVIVKNDEIIATGYNGSPRGEVNCCDTGKCYRMEHNIPHGKEYESCVAVHAEQNAIISASRKDIIGATLYLYGYDVVKDEEVKAMPCLICARFIKNAGIEKVVNRFEEVLAKDL